MRGSFAGALSAVIKADPDARGGEKDHAIYRYESKKKEKWR